MEAQLRHDRRFLHAHRLLMRTGLSLGLTFAWVFVFEYFLAFSNNITKAFIGAVIVYALSQAVMMLLTPFSASHLRRGTRASMILGASVCALALVVLGGTFAGNFSSPPAWGIVLFGILLGIYRALYWIPYRLHAVKAPHGANMLYEFLIACMPIFAGVTLATIDIGPLRLLFGAGTLILLSIIPAFAISNFGEKFSWGYADTFSNLFKERNRMFTVRAVLDGIQSAALFLLWPLAVFLIVGRSYFIMGSILTTSLIALLFGRGLYRSAIVYLLGEKVSRGSIVLDIVFSISGWLFRLVAGSPIAVVFADSYSYVSAPRGAPEPLTCDHAADAGTYIDEYTALQEIGLGLGRLIMCLFVATLGAFSALPIALTLSLLCAGLAAGGSAFLAHTVRMPAY